MSLEQKHREAAEAINADVPGYAQIKIGLQTVSIFPGRHPWGTIPGGMHLDDVLNAIIDGLPDGTAHASTRGVFTRQDIRDRARWWRTRWGTGPTEEEKAMADKLDAFASTWP